MKKWLCLLLSITLLAALAVPAMAETAPEEPPESMDATMTAVTVRVKDALKIGDDYAEFSGNWDDWLSGRWNLYWSGTGASLSVTADADGKVMDYWYYSDAESNDRFYGFDPKFPALDETEAEKTAQTWLDRLMGEGESARIDTRRTELDDGSFRYGGTIELNGLESPIGFTMRLLSDGTLRSYSRDDAYGGYVGELPAAQAKTDKTDAAAALGETVKLELYWVSDGDSGAVLRYVPHFARHIVSAETGECVDMDALYAGFDGMGFGPDTVKAEESAAMDADGMNGLTEIELAAVQGYADAMEAAELDERLREIDELGLDGFAQTGARYSQSTDGDITCDLTYTKTMTADELYGYTRANYDEAVSYGDDLLIRKYLTVDAMTGALQSVSTNYPLWEREDKKEKDQTAVAEAFLAKAAPEEFAASKLCTLSNWDDGTVWAQVEKGYFYPENRLTVTVNPSSGTVDEYERIWDDSVTFGGAKVVLEKKALAAYIDALDVTLGYAAWPVAVSEREEYAAYAENYGYSWVEELRLAWYYSGTDRVAAVDAVTGEVIAETPAGAAYAYSDLADCPEAEAIERLGAAGIGFDGGRFSPDEALDMKTAAILLLQADGYDPANWDDTRLGEFFASDGMIDPADWAPEAAVSRMDFLKMLLGASRYGAACALSGVWQTAYEDEAVVARADLGYAAMAQALGLVTDGQLRPSAVCTRAAAASMLCAFLDRG